MRQFLGVTGVTDVEFVLAEGLAPGDGQRDAAVADALATIGRLAA